ncbi:MAG: CatB-related O-acetyltransferase [Butyrivibrio sp.]|nr:CatB-related O-acetyltransferase [Butyrivibrio sp.]
MKTLITQLTEIIERTFDVGGQDFSRKIIVFPCGDVGIQCINIMERIYGLEPAYVIDNHKCKYSTKIKPITFLKDIDCNEYVLILALTNPDIYENLRSNVLQYFSIERLLELEDTEKILKWHRCDWHNRLQETICGKYSYGSLCNHMYVEQVGAFCSFADGCDVVGNHAMDYITTHPILTHDTSVWKGFPAWEDVLMNFKMEGITPKGKIIRKRIKIGNDVWLGRNVLIVNYANIGNGVIAGAGSIITKDVPDYAIVAGNPAKIIRYRYSERQIKALNKIAWWKWSDDLIRERYDDFFMDIDAFIEKYK